MNSRRSCASISTNLSGSRPIIWRTLPCPIIRTANGLSCSRSTRRSTRISTAFFTAIELEREEANDPEAIEFSVKEFCEGLRRLNSFELKNASVASQLRDGNLYLGLASGSPVSDELQHEVRKNLIGAYHSLNRHMKLFFNGGLNEELEDMENSLDEKYLAYLRNY